MTDIFQSRYFKINKFYLRSIGGWLYQSRRQRFLLLTLVLCVALPHTPPQIIAVVKCWDEPEVISELITSLVTTFFSIIRLVVLVGNSEKIFQIFRRIEIDWIWVAQQSDMQILCNYAEDGRRLTIAYSVGMYFIVVLVVIKPFVPRILQFMKNTNETLPKMLPFPLDYYGLNVDVYYYYLLIYMYTGVIILIHIFIAVDTMFLIQIQHACGMFAVVGHQLQRMTNYITKEYVKYSHPKLDPTFRHLTVCIEKHSDVIEFSKLLEASYTWVLFFGVGIGLLWISYAGVQIVSVMDVDPKAAMLYFVFEIAVITVMFFFNFFAQRLSDHSQQIDEYLCQAEWYKTSLASQKLLNLVTMRTRVPCQLTAGKFIVMSLVNFSLILRTSLSYFTFMRSTQ